MATDAGEREGRKGRDHWTLPKVVRVDIARVRYPQPRQFVINRKLETVREAVEFVVQTEEAMPERAIAPVLFVGGIRLTESEPAGYRRYRFFGLEPARLEDGSPIALGWDVSRPHQVETGFYYRVK